MSRPDRQRTVDRMRREPTTMPSTNLDLVRSINAAWERGDWSSAEWADPDIEFVVVDGPTPGSWKGLAATAQGFRDWLSAWDEYRVETDDYRELDDERVLVLTRSSAHGKAGGLVVGQLRAKGAVLYHVSGGKVTRLVSYWDRKRALADVGP
jgi:ketosteroid isomerase-like protein